MKFVVLINTLATSLIVVASAQGGLIVGTANNIVWDRGSAPAGSPTITIPISSDGGAAPNSLQSFNLGLKFSGGTGSLNISNVVNPSTNPLFPTQPTGLPAVTGSSGGVTFVSGENSAFANVSPGLTGLNAVTFNFTSTNALGIFTLLYDATFSSFFVAPATGDQTFGNPDNSPIATITVTAADTPEPAFLGILVLSPMLGFLAMKVRQRRLGLKASTEVAVLAS